MVSISFFETGGREMKKFLEVLWIIVTLPCLIFEEIARCSRTERVLIVTDHPAGQVVADRLEYKTGFVPSLFASFDTAKIHLQTMADIYLSQAATTAVRSNTLFPEIQPSFEIQQPTDLVIIDWGYTSRNGRSGITSLLQTLQKTNYSGCILIRDWHDGKFKCRKCGDTCQHDYAEFLNVALPLGVARAQMSIHMDDTVVEDGQYPIIR